ncbi:MAG: magnesium transporter [Magnetococcales bacterium]|nr:magnesium transporter [Magnetococcales bacterium]
MAMMMDTDETKSATPPAPKVSISDAILRLYRRGATAHLTQLLAKLKAADLIAILNGLPDGQAGELFAHIAPVAHAAEVATGLDDRHKRAIFVNLPVEQAVLLLNHLDTDARRRMLNLLDEEVAQRLMLAMDDAHRPTEVDQSAYQEGSAGSLMETNILALPETMTASEAIRTVQALSSHSSIFYLYVVDENRVLTGVCSLRKLILAEPDNTLKEFTNTRLIKVDVNTSQGVTAKLISRYRLLAMPVVDEFGALVGQITIDNLIDIIQEENTGSIMKMAGIGSKSANVLTQTPLQIFKTRVPWLITAFVAYLIISAILDGFEHTLSAVVQLAFFFPIVIGMSGNAGSQTGAVVVRGLALGTIVDAHFFKLLFKELGINVIQGCFYGTCLSVASYFLFWNPTLSITLGIAMTLSITCASAIAMSLPFFFKRLGADPAVAAGPLALAFIDMVGSINYLSVAFFMFKL